MDRTLPSQMPTSATALGNIARGIERIIEKHGQCKRPDYTIDVGASLRYSKHSLSLDRLGISPCLCRGRCGHKSGYYNFKRGRCLVLKDMLRLQGVPDGRLRLPPAHGRTKHNVSELQMQSMAGNAFDANLMARIFSRLFPAVGLLPPIEDTWGNNGELALETDEEDDF